MFASLYISVSVMFLCMKVYLYYPFCLKVLVLGNKRDLPNALDEKQLIEKMYVLRMSNIVSKV